MGNDWDRPENPPPPLFLGKKERDLVKQVNDELIEKVIGQQILYYSIDMQQQTFMIYMEKLLRKTIYLPLECMR